MLGYSLHPSLVLPPAAREGTQRGTCCPPQHNALPWQAPSVSGQGLVPAPGAGEDPMKANVLLEIIFCRTWLGDHDVTFT